MYERSIKTINGFSIYPEAEFWIKRELKLKLGWNDQSPAVQQFDQLIKRRFSLHNSEFFPWPPVGINVFPGLFSAYFQLVFILPETIQQGFQFQRLFNTVSATGRLPARVLLGIFS